MKDLTKNLRFEVDKVEYIKNECLRLRNVAEESVFMAKSDKANSTTYMERIQQATLEVQNRVAEMHLPVMRLSSYGMVLNMLPMDGAMKDAYMLNVVMALGESLSHNLRAMEDAEKVFGIYAEMMISK